MAISDRETFILGAIPLVANKLGSFCGEQLGDITFRQWFLLTMISRMDTRENSVADIAEFAGTTRQNVKHMVSTLEKRGYLKVSPSKEDRRALSVSLTTKARRKLASCSEPVEAATERFFEDFSPSEMALLASSLQKLIAATDSSDAAGSPSGKGADEASA